MNRKIIFSFFLAAVLFATNVNAQSVPVVGKLPKFHAGLKLGANFDQLSGGTWEQAYKPGVVFGGFAEVTKGSFGLAVEALFNTAQYGFSDSLRTGTFRAFYFNVPVLIEYRIVPRLYVQIGPQFGTLLSLTSSNSAIADPKSYFNSGAVSGVLGLQVKLPVHLVAGARYILGFTDVRNESIAGTGDAWRNRTIQAYVGFRFI